LLFLIAASVVSLSQPVFAAETADTTTHSHPHDSLNDQAVADSTTQSGSLLNGTRRIQ